MKPIVIAGVALAVAVLVWNFAFLGANMHMGSMAWLGNVVPILLVVAVLVWGLGQTKAQGRRYGGQVLAGVLISLVAGLLIGALSAFVVMPAFPDAGQEMLDIQVDKMRAAGNTEEQIEMARKFTEWMMSPTGQIAGSLFFTLLTGLILSLIIAAFIRNKEPQT